jgi:adenosylcobinamide amidohydrolase
MIEILKQHPKAAQVMKDYYINLMIESAQDLPAHFKEFLQDKGLEMSNIAEMMETAPRNLFDVFDEHGIFINVSTTNSGKSYQCDVSRDLQGESQGANTRKEADLKGVTLAIAMLENKLNSLEETNEDS